MEEEERGAAAELAAIAGAGPPPKLEDFLGGGANGRNNNDAGRGDQVVSAATAEMYDSELKFLAAGFLSGATGTTAPTISPAVAPQEQADPKMTAPAPEQKKAVDSFGQRTSIYRGVTR